MSTHNLLQLPAEEPFLWRDKADAFSRYVSTPENRVMFTNSLGHPHFTAFVNGDEGELITFGGIVVGKLLRGEDVSSLIPSLADYFSEVAEMFVNNASGLRQEYWYLMYVNALAGAIIRRESSADTMRLSRFRQSLDTMMRIAHEIEYDFNHQGYDFAARSSYTNKDAFRQPDTIGGYAYLMTLGYNLYGDEQYLNEAHLAMNKYLAFAENPWYEIPSGAMAVAAASKLSSMGYQVDVSKAIDFALDPDKGCLHLGEWGGREINGLMCGWRGNTREEALSMTYSLESMVAIPYLLSSLRYTPEYASSIAPYVLHASINMRWFFSEYLPRNMQSKPDLTEDVPYEALHREENGKTPYATGDFHDHRSVYGGSLILWLGEIIRPTEHPYILQLNLSLADFLTETSYPTFLYYNPYGDRRQITHRLPIGAFDIYCLNRHAMVSTRTEGSFVIELDALETFIVVVIPAGSTPQVDGPVLKMGNIVVDFQREGHSHSSDSK